MSFYVYILCRPDKRAPGGGRAFYVGKGSGGRIYDHEAEARKGHACYKCRVIRKVWSQGGTIQRYTVFVTDDEQEAYDEEKRLIASYGRKNLTNGTDGGEGQTGRIGELSGKTRLTWVQVRELRRRYVEETTPMKAFAAEYGISLASVEKIVQGEVWPDPSYQPRPRTQEQRNANKVRGEAQWEAALTWEQVREIRTLYPTSGLRGADIAMKYGVGAGVIHNILRNKHWYDPFYDPSVYIPVKPRASGERNQGAVLTWEQVREIRARYVFRKVTAKMLAAEYGISSDSIEKIIRRETWREEGP
jgi:hypothetical protein